jgi:phospholipase C
MLAIVVVAMGGALVCLNGCGSSGSSAPSPPMIGKAFGAGSIPLNGSTSLTFNLSNPNAGTSLTGVRFTDLLPAGLVVSTPNGLAGSCGGGTITATAGAGNVSLSGATLAASASCSFSVNVTGTTVGVQNNVTGKVTSSNGGTGLTASASIGVGVSAGKIGHVVVIFQENRTPDNLFQGLCTANGGIPGCGTQATQYDLAQSGKDSSGNTIYLKEISLAVDYDPDHSHSSFNDMCDLNAATGQCQMDGADKIPVACDQGATDCPAPDLQFGYVNPADVQPYLQMAEQYAFADHMFQTNQGPSFPAHQFIISGTSAPTAGSNLFASENPKGNGATIDEGCDAGSEATIALIDPTGNESSNPPIFPCFEHPTLTDLLEANGNTWRYYTPMTSSIWNGPEAINHICGAQDGSCQGSDWTEHVVINNAQALTDIANNQLAQVSWVIPSGQESDHAGNKTDTGPSWVASIVNAVGGSAYWADTAIFITWDDWGGWYDHVPSPQVLIDCAQWGCGYVYGFRVPLVLVSPYAKAGYISKQQHDFGSILKFVETTFGIGSLGYADASADDFSDCFNFSQTPLKFQTIPSVLKADYFLNDKTPPTPPDND